MELAVRVEYTDLTHLNRHGDYHPATRHLRIQEGMVYRKHRSVLAHELAHATYGDEPSIFDYINVKQERRADEWAAHFLIDTAEYRQAEEKYGTRIDWIAQELDIIERLVVAYERTLHRIGDNTYVNPRMGIGQHYARIRSV